MCHWKACGAVRKAHLDNFSGYYFVPNGDVTPSQISHTLLQASSEIFTMPNILSVYIDCSQKKQKTPAPSRHFHQMLVSKGVPSSELHPDLGMMGIYNYAILSQNALVLFIDHLEEIYCKKNKTWGELHELVAGFQSAVFAAGNPLWLETLIERKDRVKISQEKGILLPDLNGTKIRKFVVRNGD